MTCRGGITHLRIRNDGHATGQCRPRPDRGWRTGRSAGWPGESAAQHGTTVLDVGPEPPPPRRCRPGSAAGMSRRGPDHRPDGEDT
ncbi:hypothetical protein HBB16_14255 [Pseudonocardia sp. MCCB 268]|nr:hypothetical protein [Pseudonocardia cytotoxica]